MRNLKRSKSMNVINAPTLAEDLNIDINTIIKDKNKTTDLIKFTFYYGMHIDIKNEKTENINIYGLSKMEPELITLKLKQDLKDLAQIKKKSENFNSKNVDDALLMVKYFNYINLLDSSKILNNIRH